MTGGS
jgi:hypothetical protein